ncbi:MAG: hypothetical protein NWF04_02185 [Candidatus Bathyarchaeota archaeon]|nr:hypothetical protein [Candidatus Bathyarchaeota archaeon]
MAQDSDRTKALLGLKERLEKRLEAVEAEAAEIRDSLDAVNMVLLEKGFKRGSLQDAKTPQPQQKPPTQTPQQPTSEPDNQPKPSKPTGYKGGEPDNAIPLKTLSDETLALVYVEKDELHVLPDESKQFDVNTPPFSSFLIDRVLAKMQDKDAELARLGQLTPEQMFSYNIVREGDLIREIVLKNVDDERFRELKSSIRWTLEKMNEKIKS